MSYSKIIRNIILSWPYYFHRYLIKISSEWSVAEIDAFWRDRLQKQRINRNRIYTKKNVRTSPVQNIFENIPFLTRKVTTGGTTGSAFVFYQNRFWARQKERAYIFDIWRDVGYQPFDLRVVIRGNFDDKVIKYNWFENAYYISPSGMTNKNRNVLIRFLKSIPQFFLHCYPSSLLRLQDYLGDSFLYELPIMGVMAGSEAFPLAQMRLIENKFGFKIAHWYGHSEYAVLARYCKSCDGFHFYPTYGHVEFVPTCEKNIFKIIATSFNTVGTRFLRYDTGDLALIDNQVCLTSKYPRIKAIIGREQDFFLDREGQEQPFGPYLFGLHGVFWEWVSDVQFVQKKKGNLTVFIVLFEHFKKEQVETILRKRFAHVNLDFKYVNAIEKTMANKTSYFIRKT